MGVLHNLPLLFVVCCLLFVVCCRYWEEGAKIGFLYSKIRRTTTLTVRPSLDGSLAGRLLRVLLTLAMIGIRCEKKKQYRCV
jgi:hypothetical protein